MVKNTCCEKMGLKKGAWTPEEDKKLVTYIQRHGHWNWRQLPKYAGLSRCGKSCRLRWMNYLRPNIKRGNFSREEEEVIINLHQSLGNRWAAIAATLPGRSDNEIKNHWHANLKKRLKQNPTSSEAKLDCRKNSECGSNCKSVSEPNPFLPTGPTHQISEGSPSTLQPSLSDFSLQSTDFEVVTSTNWATDENMVSPEKISQPNGNFWTEPYLAGNSYIQEDFLVTSADPGYLFQLSPIYLGEPFYAQGLYNDVGMD